ncbi:Oidioi.mRNA.OKI2018_I69.PAR.g9618.t1.cds [Oikopleura dioica]|uniref:Oidioi.mRNA.OKI2018_I69.PAR.g9618.t1.cds n=1 Tax=Oikopleura dioica TaxID=34765 RepID=A0ABN7RQW1_OIKDI|nr:Oidioi.mRNA.OKI2018_I69.PAR.g9618.t1.cds [Oikopleura dioica]
MDKVRYKSVMFLQSAFHWWAKRFVLRFPILNILFSVAWTATLLAGFKDIEFTTDPIRLWASPESRSFKEYTKYNEYFNPFYRASMMIARLRPEYAKMNGGDFQYSSPQGTFTIDNSLKREYWDELYDLQMRLKNLNASYEFDGEKRYVTWDQTCLNPLAKEENGCSLFSPFNYFQNDRDLIWKDDWYFVKVDQTREETSYLDHLIYCARSPSSLGNKFLVNIEDDFVNGLPCAGDFGSPIFPYLAFGGYEDDDYWNGEAMIFNFINSNVEDKDSEEFARVMAWEAEFIDIMTEEAPKLKYYDVAYFCERSIEDEIDKTAEEDVGIFIIAYVVIFLYITIALGKYSSIRRVPIDMKVSLAVSGIIVILASAFAATGIFGWLGVASNLIVVEVVPFLLLAIGADNVFILVMDIQREKRRDGESLDDLIARVFSRAGPSMLLCAITESTVFFMGSVIDMPAIKVFALNAGIAILFNFILQITAFLAIVKLDLSRQNGNRWDIICCYKSRSDKDAVNENKESVIDKFFRNYFTPVLMHDLVGFVVICAFSAMFGYSLYSISTAVVGLNQNLSVPLNSYVAKYFDFMETYLMVGVPVYFVLEGKYPFHKEEFSNLICGTSGCDLFSLSEQISRASLQPEKSKIATQATIWVDDYKDWLKPSSSCCRTENCNYRIDPDDPEYNQKCDFCPANVDAPAFPIFENSCLDCQRGILSPEKAEESFKTYLDYFLLDKPNEFCSKGGYASYSAAVNYTMADEVVYDSIAASAYMAYHPVCVDSVDCQANLEMGRELAHNITLTIREKVATINNQSGLVLGDEDYVDPESISVWTYAIYYPYYEQYITLGGDALIQLGICLIPVFVFTFILLGFDVVSGLIVLVTVDLISAAGLSVEFCGHTVRTFALTTEGTRKDRTIQTMSVMGPSVLLGVALTNLPGIVCLNWASAQLIEIFFFRMNFVMTLLGIAHGLILLPVILAYFGPNPNKAKIYEEQQEAIAELGRTRSETKTDKKTDSIKMKPSSKIDPAEPSAPGYADLEESAF